MTETTAFKTSATSVSASGQTGGTCLVNGPYKSGGTSPITVFLQRGQKFPTGIDGRATSWTMVREG
ncbi:MAG TPA: hypothetical protein VJQ56_03575 [Blastocatellia bacterium]|nr:hypothetical protein [Blastocatellia bacterium]